MKLDRIQHILKHGRDARILVIGDVMLDEFVWGKVSRISPEAPVPVVEVSSESSYPGGAANVARNLVCFTPRVSVLGVIGDDAYGRQLTALLEEEGIDSAALIVSDAAPTIVKTRIIARQQQVVRVDREKRNTPSDSTMTRLVEVLKGRLQDTDAIIFEDYGKGMLSQRLTTTLLEHIGGTKIVTVDPNPNNPLDWSGATAIKPNRSEAFLAVGAPPSEPHDDPLRDAPLLDVASRLSAKWDVGQLLITLGEHGMILFERGRDPYHSPTKAQEVFDVSGAGDTAIALYTLALCAGATAREATEISNHASGIVVGKLGTATVSAEEILASFRNGT